MNVINVFINVLLVPVSLLTHCNKKGKEPGVGKKPSFAINHMLSQSLFTKAIHENTKQGKILY